MAIFGPKPWVNHFGKMSIFRLFELQVFIAQKGDFSIQNIEKVLCLTYSAKKKNVGKMAIFGTKPWVNPFGKMSIFRILELLVFIAYKGAFSFQIIVKVIFLTNIALKKRVGKMAILGPKPWVNPFGKMSIFRLLELLVFIAYKGALSFQIIVKVNFLNNIALKKRVGKMAIFGPKPWINPF